MSETDRPFGDKSITELENLFGQARKDQRTLAMLKAELGRRGTRRALHLLANVEDAMRSGNTTTEVLTNPPLISGAPSCPSCGAPMKLRTARTGRNAGGQFWGCTQFPECRGTRDFGEPDNDRGPDQPSRRHGLLPVEWIEGAHGAHRPDFIPEYLSVGAIPGVLHHVLSQEFRPQQELGELLGMHAELSMEERLRVSLRQALSQCVLLSRRGRERQGVGEDALLASALLVKLLRRGRAPLATLGVEREALRAHGLLDRVRELDAESQEVGWEARSGASLRASPEAVMSAVSERVPFVLDPDFDFGSGAEESLLDSEAESWFLNEWVPSALGPEAGHWFTPQAPLDRLIESGGMGDGSGGRRIDFLFHHPGGPPFAIEIDGPDHDATAEVDEARDESLRSIGIEVLRVTNAEVLEARGLVLDRIRSRCQEALAALPTITGDEEAAASLVVDCSIAAKVQFAVARAVQYGWLSAGADWEIEISGAGGALAGGVRDVLKLLDGFDVLYGVRSVPASCTVRMGDRCVAAWMRTDGGEWVETTDPEEPSDRLRICVESSASPFQAASDDGFHDFVIRPAFVPALLATEPSLDLGRTAISASSYGEASPALGMFLRNIFRKREFRPMQGEAVFNVLRENDSVVLLQTGAGKSVIYQLAGMLMPGITLVVDPIIALIEDQVEGLSSYGIDRAVPITRDIQGVERERLLRRVERGEYQFVLHSPERLQSPQFRSALRALVECSFVNLAVIDEAHCVSEWGHDFRPAYLNLADNLRRLCRDRGNRPPPLLALTGTASRAVLRDMLIDLGIDRGRPEALIRPESFDRSEIHFEIVRTSPREDPNGALRGVLNALPGKFGLPRAEFYRPSGRETASGIVFVPWVRGRIYGVLDVRSIVRRVTGSEVTMYSGNSPWRGKPGDWDEERGRNAVAFKANRVSVLVATKAFGMGIDKPNIRYTVHFGMPMSLESFYQEAGRAGRDRKPARSTVVFSEYDKSRSEELIDPDLALEELRELFQETNRDRQSGDDLTRALWFHLEAFSGVEREIDDARELIDGIGDLSVSRRMERLWEDEDPKRQEKAIYRLLKLGVICDYEVDFRKKFIIHVNPFHLDRCKQQLTDYVRAATPGKSEPFVRRVNEINPGRPRDAALALTRMLIEFTYDEIERSRRRSIREAVLLARQAGNDSEIRRRLLDYLQEGLGAERIEELLEREKVELSEWWELVTKVQTEMDAGELRGLCIRALESYPDHPGLLLARALAESMCSDHDEKVSSTEIGKAISTGIEKYEISQTDMEAIIDEMFNLASTRARDLGPPLVLALLDLADEQPDFAFVENWAFKGVDQLDDPRVNAVMATRRIRKVVDQLTQVGDRVAEQYEAAGATETLGG